MKTEYKITGKRLDNALPYETLTSFKGFLFEQVKNSEQYRNAKPNQICRLVNFCSINDYLLIVYLSAKKAKRKYLKIKKLIITKDLNKYLDLFNEYNSTGNN